MDRQTLRDWVHRSNTHGPSGLKDNRRRGNPRRLSVAQQAELAEQQLLRARQLLAEAETALQQVREAFFRVKAREDALKKRKDLWQDEQHSHELREEELATAELLQGRTHRSAFH